MATDEEENEICNKNLTDQEIIEQILEENSDNENYSCDAENENVVPHLVAEDIFNTCLAQADKQFTS